MSNVRITRLRALTPTRTFRRHLPAWVGLARYDERVCGFYARLGHQAVLVTREPLR